MNKKWLFCVALPLSAGATTPQFTVTDLGAVDRAGAGLAWKQIQGQPDNRRSGLGGNPVSNVIYATFGLAVGTSSTTQPDDLPSTEAALWNGNTVTGLGWLPGARGTVFGGPNSTAFALNSVGDVVGQSDTEFDGFPQPSPYVASHAFLWNNGAIRDLGTLVIPTPTLHYDSNNFSSMAEGVNDFHEVVGWAHAVASADNSLLQRAFFYANGSIYNLTYLLVGSPPIRLTDATSINCQGNISAIGYGLSGGSTHSYLLTRVGPTRNCPP